MLDIKLGMNHLEIDYFIKIGGSLLSNIEGCKELSATLALAGAHKRIVLFPGGGAIDNYIESYNDKFQLSRSIFHQTTMLAMDQTALLFSNYQVAIVPVDNLIHCKEVLDKGQVPILMPSRLVFGLDPFRYTSRCTSDSMTLYFAKILEVENVVIMKSIDGIMTDENKLIPLLSPAQLKELDQNCVDEVFPLLCERVGKTPIIIINGLKGDVVKQLLLNGEIVCGTTIQSM
ncbi:hypothetical protein [Paenibacillus sp. 1011MAR3C5]|uniref:amino acid kinase family protein n=1 Tax=Paenibacillus sp. 1011MAR3C5 TaxID=1675787 RepID=UPI0016021194|nr:hypothetical protein [Paenibacillus sp. 1011MAR3C5]